MHFTVKYTLSAGKCEALFWHDVRIISVMSLQGMNMKNKMQWKFNSHMCVLVFSAIAASVAWTSITEAGPTGAMSTSPHRSNFFQRIFGMKNREAAAEAVTDINGNTVKSPSDVRKGINQFAYRITRSLGCDHLGQAIAVNGQDLWLSGTGEISESSANSILWDYLKGICGSTSSACYQKTQKDLIALMGIYRSRNIDLPQTKEDIQTHTENLQAAIKSVNSRKGFAKIGCRLTKNQALEGLKNGEREMTPDTGPGPESFSESVLEAKMQEFVKTVTGEIGCPSFEAAAETAVVNLSSLAGSEINESQHNNFLWLEAEAMCQKNSSCTSKIIRSVNKIKSIALGSHDDPEAARLSFILALEEMRKTAEEFSLQCTKKPAAPSDGGGSQGGVHAGGGGSGGSSGDPAPSGAPATDPPAQEGGGTPPAPVAGGAGGEMIPQATEVSKVHFPSKFGDTTLEISGLDVNCPAQMPKVCYHKQPHNRNALVLDPGHTDRDSRNGQVHGNIHEGQLNMTSSLLFRQMVLKCLSYDSSSKTGVNPAAIQLTRWPGETRYGEFEDPLKAKNGAYMVEKAGSHLMDQINHLMDRGTRAINNTSENDDSSTVLSFHTNCAGVGKHFHNDRPEVYYQGQNSLTLSQNMMAAMVGVHGENAQSLVKKNGYITQKGFNVLNTGSSATHKVLLEPYYMDAQDSLAEIIHNEVAAGNYQFVRTKVTQTRDRKVTSINAGPVNKHPKTGESEKGYFIAPTQKKVVESLFQGFVNNYKCDDSAN